MKSDYSIGIFEATKISSGLVSLFKTFIYSTFGMPSIMLNIIACYLFENKELALILENVFVLSCWWSWVVGRRYDNKKCHTVFKIA